MKNRRGMTVIELIIGITIGAMVALVGYILLEPIQNWLFTEARQSGMDSADMAMSRMIEEIRRIKMPDRISTALPTSLGFTDYNNDAVSFSLSGTDLQRGTDVLARDVSNLQFEYLDRDGNVAAAPEDIRTIRVVIDIASGDQVIHLRSAQRIRNAP